MVSNVENMNPCSSKGRCDTTLDQFPPIPSFGQQLLKVYGGDSILIFALSRICYTSICGSSKVDVQHAFEYHIFSTCVCTNGILMVIAWPFVCLICDATYAVKCLLAQNATYLFSWFVNVFACFSLFLQLTFFLPKMWSRTWFWLVPSVLYGC